MKIQGTKQTLRGIAFLLLSAVLSWGATTVVITSPSDGLTVPRQFGVVAYAYGDEPVHALQVYLDHAGKVSEVVNPAHNRINSLITATPGNWLLTVQAVDSAGRVLGRAQLRFDVTASPVVLAGLDQKTGEWLACEPSRGCHSGGNATPTPPLFSAGSARLTEDGSAAEFQSQNFNDPPAPAFDTAFWWLPHPNLPESFSHYFRYDFDLYIESEFAEAPQAIEWEVQQTINGSVYNFGWQANYAGAGGSGKCAAAPQNVWRVFNYAASCWEQAGLSLTRFSGNTWYHVFQENHVDAHGEGWHDALTITNKTTGESIRLDPSVFDASLKAWRSVVHVPPFFPGRGNEFHNAIQFDMNSHGSVYRVFIDKMSVTFIP